MTEKTIDVLAIGNAIVDVIADGDDDFLARHGMAKGGMQLIDAEAAEQLYAAMGSGRETSGGSAANTVAGLAALGLKAAFVGQLGDDDLGKIFTHDIRSLGVTFDTPPRGDTGPTARCLILVTPDAQRTMNTFLGAAQHLDRGAIDADAIARARILYLEGYLWDPEEPRAAMEEAIRHARAAGTKVAFTLSDGFVVERHRDGFLKLIDEGKIDILFANEQEFLHLAGASDLDAALESFAGKVPTLVVTRSEQGAVAISGDEQASVPAEPIERLVDTTGAGDLFAAGFLAGQARGRSLEDSLRLGAIAASEVIQHYGARPERDLAELASDLIQ
ncbi:adenosine kinase [Sphingomonas sabuli]|uniref:Adenosine kinase n=1 Tax=Sphingomonas sabuli TaxID=2764186 RepID=A0A7G9KZE9_9SPHN|nr:adenosine kinase [Sphingomonas sabuli]QNM81748.1 adenosine kinase [Sphingomonas sabuli]